MQRRRGAVTLRRRPARRGTASAGPRARVRRRGAAAGAASGRAAAGGGATSPPSSITVATTTCASERPGARSVGCAPARIRIGRAGRATGCERIPVELVGARRWRRSGRRRGASRGGDHALGARGTDAAPRRLHGAPERLRVGRVGQQREVGDRVARPRRARTGRGCRARGAGSRLPRARAGSGRARSRCGRARGSRRAAMPAASASAISPATHAASPRSSPKRCSSSCPPAPRTAESAFAVRCGLWRTHATAALQDLRARAEVAPSTICRCAG